MKLIAVLILFLVIRYLITYLCREKRPLKTFMDDNDRETPTLKINETTVPQSYLDNTKGWDSHLYKNQIVLLD